MSVPSVFLRRARIRALKEGQIQRGRVESTENDAKDDAERMQDYGFAASPVDGQGLALTVGGHTIILRVDRLAERPELAAYEVSVWHKEGHSVTLRDGKVIDMDCDTLNVNAAVAVHLNTPAVTTQGTVNAGGRITAPGVTAGGKALEAHNHNVPALGVSGNNN